MHSFFYSALPLVTASCGAAETHALLSARMFYYVQQVEYIHDHIIDFVVVVRLWAGY